MKKSKLNQAKEFAKKKHANQKRKDGKTPYWKHLEDVVVLVKKLRIRDVDILCAGWLHDTIEDTSTDYDDIYEKFGKKTADIVASVTKDTRLPRKERERQYLIQLKKSSWQAKTIKLCDIIANISDLKNSRYDFQKQVKQVKEKLEYLHVIKGEIISNRSKIPELTLLLGELNLLLEKYDQPKITF